MIDDFATVGVPPPGGNGGTNANTGIVCGGGIGGGIGGRGGAMTRDCAPADVFRRGRAVVHPSPPNASAVADIALMTSMIMSLSSSAMTWPPQSSPSPSRALQ